MLLVDSDVDKGNKMPKLYPLLHIVSVIIRYRIKMGKGNMEILIYFLCISNSNLQEVGVYI